jgi:hypothetical protein
MSSDTPADIPKSSLMAVAHSTEAPSIQEHRHDSSSTQPSRPTEGEEQALELHEVLELQNFSERKAWIEDKIKVN